MHPNGRIYPLSKLNAGPGIGLQSRKVVCPFISYLTFQFSLMFSAVNAVCVCAKQGMLTEGKSVSGKKKRKTPWRKNINEQFCHS